MTSTEIPALLSIVFTTQNDDSKIHGIISQIEDIVSRIASDYEIIIVDNGSTDNTSNILQLLTSENGKSNLQVYTLAGRVDDFTARWVGIENAIGDIIAAIDPRHGDINHLELLAREAASGNDIVLTMRTFPRGRKSFLRTLTYKAFGVATKVATGLDLDSYSTSLISISRKVINYLLQFPDPQIKFRNIASTTGFKRTSIAIPPHFSLSLIHI